MGMWVNCFIETLNEDTGKFEFNEKPSMCFSRETDNFMHNMLESGLTDSFDYIFTDENSLPLPESYILHKNSDDKLKDEIKKLNNFNLYAYSVRDLSELIEQLSREYYTRTIQKACEEKQLKERALLKTDDVYTSIPTSDDYNAMSCVIQDLNYILLYVGNNFETSVTRIIFYMESN